MQIHKTKDMVLGKMLPNKSWKYNDNDTETAGEFTFFGTVSKYTCSFQLFIETKNNW